MFAKLLYVFAILTFKEAAGAAQIVTTLFPPTEAAQQPTTAAVTSVEVKPLHLSSVISDTPSLIWRVSSDDELNILLRFDDYQQHQWPLRDGGNNGWSQCSSCLRNGMINTFRLKSANAESPIAQICQPNPPKCPEITQRGYWLYDSVLDSHMVNFSTPESYDGLEGFDYYTRDCSLQVKRENLTYMVMTESCCYGSNSSLIFKTGLPNDVSDGSPKMKVFIFPECPPACELVGDTGLCICKGNSSLTLNDALSECERMSGSLLPDIYLERVLDEGNAGLVGVVWVSSSQTTYDCVNIGDSNAINRNISCNTANQGCFVCLYNDTNQYGWQPNLPLSPCTEECGGGTQHVIRYRLSPHADENGTSYTPDKDAQTAECNTQACPWTDTAVWGGCWKNLSDVFEVYGNESLLDSDEYDSESFVDECAAVSFGISTAFAIRKRQCYVANISSESEYIGLASHKCAHYNNINGSGYDVYRFTPEVLFPQWSPWSDQGSCSLACGSGTIKKSRGCYNPPPSNHTDDRCSGNDSMESSCNASPCPEPFDFEKIGCYQVFSVKAEISDSLLDGRRPETRQDPLRKCALVAKQRNQLVFGLLANGQCVIDDDLICTYGDLPRSTECANDPGVEMALYAYTSGVGVSFERCRRTSTMTIPSTANSLNNQFGYLSDSANINARDASLALDQLGKAIDSISVVDEEAIKAVSEILHVIAEKVVVSGNEAAEELTDQVANTIETVTLDKYAVVWGKSQEFTSVITSMETMLIKTSTEMTTSKNDTGRERFTLMTNNLPPSNEFGNTGFMLDAGPSKVKIRLPLDVMALSLNTTPYAFVVYSNISTFIGTPIVDGESIVTSDATKILRLSDTVVTVKLGSNIPYTRLNEDISVKIPVATSLNETELNITTVCVFWNVTSSEWSSEGCSTERTGDDLVDCRCNHLTSFSVLLKVTDYEPEENLALTVISYVGCALSLLCLVTAFIIFIYLDNLKSERKKIHMNLIVALGLAQITYLVGINLTENALTCKFIAILLHFLYMSTFTWMLSEGIHLYHKIIAVFESEGKLKRLLYYLIGWGLPVIIVSVSVGVRHDGYGTENFCWLSVADGLIWAFAGPVCAVIVVNLIIMIMVIRVVVKSSAAVVPAEKRKLQTVKAGVKSVLILTPLLGVNWLFGLLAVNEDLEVFDFIFVIINSMQGLFIFIFHCVGSAEVRSAFQRKRELASRSMERSSEDRRRRWAGVGSWLHPNSKRTSHWPPNIFQKNSSSTESRSDDSGDVVSAMLDGNVGRNLGGLKHILVKPATPPDQDPCGVSNRAYREDEYIVNSPPLHSEFHSLEAEQNTSYSTRMSVSTASTSLGESSESRTSSRHSDSTDNNVTLSQPSSLNRSTLSRFDCTTSFSTSPGVIEQPEWRI